MLSKGPVERYQALLDAARCFSRAMDSAALIDEILRRAKEVMHAGACSFLLPDARTGELILHSTDPWMVNLPQPLRVPPGAGIAGAVYQSKRPINLKDAQTDPRHYINVSNRVGILTRALLTIPLLDGAACLGVLQALNPQERESFNAEDEEIFEGFGGLIVNALVRLEAQRREIEQAAARQQLLLAKEIQDTFLPPTLSQFPFCEVYHRQLPAQMVGGDFGFVQPVGTSRLLLGLGDVCGKGIPAALTMARATAVIEALTHQLQADLGEWVTKLNPLLTRELKAGRFISMVMLLADVDKRTLQICTAGQFPPLYFDGQKWKSCAVRNHLPLGISPTAKYVVAQVELRPGDSWLLFTDGFPETRNHQGEEYSLERFAASLPVGLTAAETLSAAYQAWDNYRDSTPQHDDASLLLLAWRGQPPAPELHTTCSPANLVGVRHFVEQWAHFAGFGDTVVGQIVMACDEASSNIFRHGYHEQPGPVRVRVETADKALIIQITDEAAPVNAEDIRGRELSDLRPGGLGTFVMTQVFDEVTYVPLGTGNSLTLRKALPQKPGVPI
ncbi:MAG TPA: SpoIIE family protein phosphatase [Candidatus Acidoferrum sp.]|nr:SpoIIE family protein phosphatase [Candidatus Acidoferrum sp.]